MTLELKTAVAMSLIRRPFWVVSERPNTLLLRLERRNNTVNTRFGV
jgi:hypothetical protein